MKIHTLIFSILALCALLASAGCGYARLPSGEQAAIPGETLAAPPTATAFTAAAPVSLTDTPASTAARVTPSSAPTAAPASTPAAEQDPAQPTPTFDPSSWSSLPVIPELSPRALAVLKDGLARGNNPHAFSKIGDCESQADWFLAAYDQKAENYALGAYQAELAPVLPYYAGSFERNSLAARPGFSAASLLAPIWADKKQCQKNETPLACEYRVNQPLVAFILLGSNDASNPKTFEGHMRAVIDYSLQQGVLPILGTKADNVEGNHYLNSTIARLAFEYDLPLWNYWAAVQGLPAQGLQEDGVHLTYGAPYFDNPAALQKAWPVRNLNALQILRVVMQQTQ